MRNPRGPRYGRPRRRTAAVHWVDASFTRTCVFLGHTQYKRLAVSTPAFQRALGEETHALGQFRYLTLRFGRASPGLTSTPGINFFRGGTRKGYLDLGSRSAVDWEGVDSWMRRRLLAVAGLAEDEDEDEVGMDD